MVSRAIETEADSRVGSAVVSYEPTILYVGPLWYFTWLAYYYVYGAA